MPLTREYRVFFLDGEPVLSSEYWEEGEYAGPTPPLDQLTSLARRIESRFFTMDVARQTGGDWRVVELGDGQVAGLPSRAEPRELYTALFTRLSASL
jgi:hypothetical protein